MLRHIIISKCPKCHSNIDYEYSDDNDGKITEARMFECGYAIGYTSANDNLITIEKCKRVK